MKAAVLEALDRLNVKEVPDYQVGANEALLRVHSCAICGSDIRIMHHGNPRVNFPQIVGHEAAGDIVKVGDSVQRFKVGDRVAVGADVPCGCCFWCQNGMGTNCAINYAIGYQFPGGFAEYLLLNELILNQGPVHLIPDSLSYDEAALAEPLACAINGLEMAKLGVGDSLAIIGAGPIGCMMIEMGRHMGATNIIVIQRSQNRLDMARQFGADHYFLSEQPDIVENVRAVTRSEGPDIVMVTCASPAAQELAITIARHRARVNLFGGLPKDSRNISVPSNVIHYKECMVMGSHGSLPRHHWKAIQVISAGMVRPARVITHRFPLENVREAFEMAESHAGLKVIVNP
ncbi:MAG TPA: alcohol dehydrogenase catalytic domain-containing protein [Atribacteraceae bacterium]|nr:alcohol dehydrogenase catalytic domain-containing protein [Atribacteraceae bacterium]